MTAPDAAPILPATLRVAVVWPDGSHDPHTVDIPTNMIVQTLRALEDHVGLAVSIPRTRKAVYAAMAAALSAADDGHARVIASAGLWLFLNHPDTGHAKNAQRLSDALEHDGSALLLALVGRGGGGWTFRLHAMPRWPYWGQDSVTKEGRSCPHRRTTSTAPFRPAQSGFS
jgi:hypothetical protein